MAKFRVHVRYSSIVAASKVFEAETADEAAELADNEDWRVWQPESPDIGESYIDWIEDGEKDV